MKILVTGGAGFIGSHLAEELAKQGHSVVILDNLSTGNIKNIESFKDKIKFVEGDINDKNLVEKLTKDIDCILHQAALSAVQRSIKDPLLSSEVNVQGSLNIFNAAVKNKVGRVIYASSSSVYGDTEELPKIETMLRNPRSPYALQKSIVEDYASQFNRLFGLKTVGLRYFNVFGERQDPHSNYAAVVPNFIKLILNKETPIIYGDGETTRDFTYVSNVVDANIKAIEAKKINCEVLNIACGRNKSLNDLVSYINQNTGERAKPKYQDFRQGDVRHSLADIARAKKIIGWKPKIQFEDGLGKVIEHLKNNL